MEVENLMMIMIEHSYYFAISILMWNFCSFSPNWDMKEGNPNL